MPSEIRFAYVVSVIAFAVMALPVRADFRYEIAPIFARHGCAAADCHGGATGRGGFKLSLFATEPRADYEAITRELGARRIDFQHAKNSLLLKKPTKTVKHEGGRIFDKSSQAYQQLLHWIESGAPYESNKQRGASLSGLKVSNDQDRLTVTAEFSKGEDRDVSHLAMFESTVPTVADVDEHGVVTRHGPGKAWLLARYSGMSVRTRINIPFPGKKVSVEIGDHPLDRAWAEALQEQNLKPAAEAAPHVLARRLYFDLAGRPPTPDELRAFLSEPPNKRTAVRSKILLSREAFVDAFEPHIESWFVQPSRNRDLSRVGDALGKNEPLSSLVSDLFRPGLGLKGDPRDQAEFVGSQSLGISIGCARCHNHPHDRWTQAEHLRFSALFRTRQEDGQLALDPFYVPGEGHRPVMPALLPLGNVRQNPGVSPDTVLTSFIVDGGHDLFSRNIANRVFEISIGHGLVNAPDDHRISNPPIHGSVLDVLASHFKKSGYDLRKLVRFIVTSKVYALASDPLDVNSLAGDPALKYFARREARSLTRPQFQKAIRSVIGHEPSHAVGKRRDLSMMESDSSSETTSPLADQLALLNSGLIQRGLATNGNEVEVIFTFSASAEQALEELFTLVLSRTPRDEEVEQFLPIATKALSKPQARDDLTTALLLSREFGSIR
ncbi:MAG: DUF1553 domain-containing protein [Verrucomicrobiaceae bacterium]|nr:DUF1553 domain-containing protein [Verrucomicrobiaceae bacterium]